MILTMVSRMLLKATQCRKGAMGQGAGRETRATQDNELATFAHVCVARRGT